MFASTASMTRPEDLLPLVQRLRRGLPGLRDLLIELGFSYANEYPRAPDGGGILTEPPRLIAWAGNGQIAVLYLPVHTLKPDIIERVCQFYRKQYPYLLCWFSSDNNSQWEAACLPLSDAPLRRYILPFRLDKPEGITRNALRVLQGFHITEEDDTLTLYECFLSGFDDRESEVIPETDGRKKDGKALRDAVSTWMGLFSKYPLLSFEEERDLTRQAADGDRTARKRLILSNLRLVFSVARKYQGRGLDLEDLLQEGTLGLIHAIDKYDYSRGFRFSTYATHWIRQALGRAVENHSRLIRLPSHMYETMRRLRQARELLEDQMDSSPTLEEVARAAGLEIDKARKAISADAGDLLSLDFPAGDGDTPLGALLCDRETPPPFARLIDTATRDTLHQALRLLKPREREVLYLRFGFEDHDPHTLEEIGTKLGLSRERARQIEAGALAKLRCAKTGQALLHHVFDVLPPLPLHQYPQFILSNGYNTSLKEQCRQPHYPISGSGDSVCQLNSKLVRHCDLSESLKVGICKTLGDEASLTDVANLSREELESLPGVGNKKVDALVALLSRARLSLRIPGNLKQEEVNVDETPIILQEAALPSDIPSQLALDITVETIEKPSRRATPANNSSLCARCNLEVVMKPTFNGRWYRCHNCGDIRAITNTVAEAVAA